MRVSIRIKILAIFAATLIITSVLNLTFISQILKKDYRATLHSELLVLGDNLQTQLKRITSLGISTRDIEGFDRQCRDLVEKNEHVVQAMIIDAEGTIIFHNDASYQGKKLPQKAIFSSIKAGKTEIHSIKENNDSIYFAVLPFGDGPDYFEYAVVISSPAKIINSRIFKLINRCNIVLLSGFGLAALLLLVSLTTMLTSPLAAILKTIKDITKSRNLGKRIDIKSRDEIGQIANAFNKMTADLQQSTTSIEQKKPEGAIKQLNHELEEAVEKLGRANNEIKDFVYIASHDLREPVRKISSFGELLSDSLKDKLSDDEKENLGFMIDGAKRMQQMIDALLTYSRVTTRGVGFEPVDLNKVVEELCAVELAVKIEETGAEIAVPERLHNVNCDPAQIRQLMQNLIADGLKYQKKGVAPEITIRSSVADNGMVRVEVADNGIGIKQEQFENVFVMFKRLHSRREYEGTGIGLAICKKIVERHEGDIGVISTYGEGTTFWFTMPVSRTSEKEQMELISSSKAGFEGQQDK